jgi:hypothetical protein
MDNLHYPAPSLFPHVRFPAFSNEIGRDLPASVRFLGPAHPLLSSIVLYNDNFFPIICILLRWGDVSATLP